MFGKYSRKAHVMSGFCLFATGMFVVMVGCGSPFLLPQTNRGLYVDVLVEQPLGTDGQPAYPARVSVHGQGVYVENFLEWPMPDGAWIDSRDVTHRAEQHLEASKARRHQRMLDPSQIDIVRRGRNGEPGGVHQAVEPIWTIVSLDPLLLVESQGTIQLWDEAQVDVDDLSRRSDGPTKARILLGRGFNHGLRIPYSPEPRWTSPAAGERIYHTNEVSPTERIIECPGRPIRLIRDGQFWKAMPTDPS